MFYFCYLTSCTLKLVTTAFLSATYESPCCSPSHLFVQEKEDSLNVDLGLKKGKILFNQLLLHVSSAFLSDLFSF